MSNFSFFSPNHKKSFLKLIYNHLTDQTQICTIFKDYFHFKAISKTNFFLILNLQKN